MRTVVRHCHTHNITKIQIPNISRPKILKDGSFDNPWPTWKENFYISPYMLIKQFANGKPPLPSPEILDQKLPVLNLTKNDFDEHEPNTVKSTWIGHSTFLVQMDGVNFLTDPVWSNRASPFKYAGPKRLRKTPISLAELPQIDFVLISHNHYDHLDSLVVSTLRSNTNWVVPMGLKNWFLRHGIDSNKVIELDWWDQWKYNDNVKITFTPAQHWSRRTYSDTKKSLWGSFVVEGSKQKVFFGGDTAYCKAFSEIGEHLGPIDLSLIPIGAYAPKELFQHMHVDPEEAVQMHIDLKSKKSIGMHWGTFMLTMEPYFEPVEKLKQTLQKLNIDENQFITVKIGESIKVTEKV